MTKKHVIINKLFMSYGLIIMKGETPESVYGGGMMNETTKPFFDE